MNEIRNSGEGYLPSIDLKKAAEILKQDRDGLSKSFASNSFVDRIRSGIFERVPFLRESIGIKPMDVVRAELRGVALDLTNNLPHLLKTGKPVVDEHNSILDLYTIAKEEPDNWELTEALDQKLQAEALKDKSLQLDEETAALIAEMLGSDRPEERDKKQARIFSAAEQRLNLTKPIIDVTLSTIKATTEFRAEAMRQYSKVMAISPALDQIFNSARTLQEGISVDRSAQEEIVAVLAHGLKTVSLVMQYDILSNQMYEGRDLPRLKQISEAAQKILGGSEDEDSERI